MSPANTLNIGPLPLGQNEPGDPNTTGAHDSREVLNAHAAERERLGPVMALKPDLEASETLREDFTELEEVIGEVVEGASVRGTDRHAPQQVLYTIRPGGAFGPSVKDFLPLSQLPKTVERIAAAKERSAKLAAVVDETQAAAVAAAQGGRAAELEAENAALRAQLAEAENARLKSELAALGADDAAATDGCDVPVSPLPATPTEGAAADKSEGAKPGSRPRAKRSGKGRSSSN